ncbi:Nuclease-related domain protein [Caloramator mitchellensis]|uniref:Nuclease-related domain protein n=1 Tax=Caloramator mitchellensis TaxID=908809 RepID=A0A0R3K0R1_CALMK|nr:nuclease-related domain-containing protein [Caloramator mitchellensis]KRQ86450.1 Nuclease-related domain protein [Caloramator mitchellensis]
MKILKEEKSLKKQYKVYLISTIISFLLLLWNFQVIINSIDKPSNVSVYSEIIFLFIFAFSSSRFVIFARGSIGEKRVVKALSKFPDEYILINDIRINNGEKSAQIDHILVCPKGIFSIETKSHLGKIYGNEEEQYWMQYKKSSKGRTYGNKFYNPIKQNKGHINALRNLLNDKYYINSIIVFTSAKELKVYTKHVPVLKVNKLYDYLSNYATNNFLGIDEINEVAELILKNDISK